MMKRNILAVVIPALLVAGAANAAEIYNKDGNKVDIYGKAVGLHYFTKDNGANGYGGNGDKTYARLGFKGESKINDQLTGYGQWENNFQVITSGITSGAVIIKAKPFAPRKRPKRTITTAAMVPKITAIVAAQAAIVRLKPTALIIASSWNNSLYQRVDHPAHTVTSFELLKE